MRLWSLHPRYLDSAGLTACWREALLAQKVLQGQTRGYRNHPQLERFRQSGAPLKAINNYLCAIWDQASDRGYHFDSTKISIEERDLSYRLTVTEGQMEYEWLHLLKKLSRRSTQKHEQNMVECNNKIEPHPLFTVIPGEVEQWEKTK